MRMVEARGGVQEQDEHENGEARAAMPEATHTALAVAGLVVGAELEHSKNGVSVALLAAPARPVQRGMAVAVLVVDVHPSLDENPSNVGTALEAVQPGWVRRARKTTQKNNRVVSLARRGRKGLRERGKGSREEEERGRLRSNGRTQRRA